MLGCRLAKTLACRYVCLQCAVKVTFAVKLKVTVTGDSGRLCIDCSLTGRRLANALDVKRCVSRNERWKDLRSCCLPLSPGGGEYDQEDFCAFIRHKRRFAHRISNTTYNIYPVVIVHTAITEGFPSVSLDSAWWRNCDKRSCWGVSGLPLLYIVWDLLGESCWNLDVKCCSLLPFVEQSWRRSHGSPGVQTSRKILFGVFCGSIIKVSLNYTKHDICLVYFVMHVLSEGKFFIDYNSKIFKTVLTV